MWSALRIGSRIAVKNPLWAGAIALSLAIGIGATAAIASAAHSLMLYRIPAPNAGQLVELENSIGGRGVEENLTDFRRLQEVARGFLELAAYRTAAFQVEGERLQGQFVSANYFAVLGLPLAVEDGSVVVSEAYWRRKFNGDPGIAGKTIRVNGQALTVAGVAPAGFRGVQAGFLPSIWMPVTAGKRLMGTTWPSKEEWLGVNLFGRMRAGMGLGQAQLAMDAVVPRVGETLWPWKGERKVRLSAAGQFLSNFRDLAELVMRSLGMMALFVLLIACANAANLQLARGAARQKEMEVRRALGATRMQLVGQLTAESAVLGLAGGLGGLLIAHGFARSIALFPLPDMPVALDLTIQMDWPVALFAAGVTVLATTASGLVAAFRTTSAAPNRPWLRDGLVVTQAALTVTLLTGTLLLTGSLRNARALNTGFHADRTLLAEFDPLMEGLRPAQVEPLVAEMLQTPGAAVSNSVPLTMGGWLADLGLGDQATPPMRYGIMPGFFSALGIPIRQGRDLATTAEKGRVLINETLARQLFGTNPALGRRIGKKQEFEVIGVVGDHVHFLVGEKPPPILYQPLFQEAVNGPLTLAVRGGRLPQVRTAFFHIRDGETQLESALFVPRAAAALMTAFGAMSLLLTGIGLYAMIAYSVSRRTRELGIRIALGAAPADIARTVSRRPAVLAAIGIGAGLGVACLCSGLLQETMYGLSATDPRTYISAAAVFLTTAVLAGWGPARRACRLEPMESIRQD